MQCHSHQTADGPQGRAVRVRITFDEAGLQLRSTPFGVIVKLADTKPAGLVGGPALPQRVVKIAVPALQWPHDMEVENADFMVIGDKPLFVVPMQPARAGVAAQGPAQGSGQEPAGAPPHQARRQRCACQTTGQTGCACCHEPRNRPSEFPEPFAAPATVPPDPALYTQAVRTPRPLAVALAIEQVGLVRVAVVQLNPVRINAHGMLELCRSFDLVLRFAEQPPLDDPQAAYRLLEQRLGRAIDPQRIRPHPEPVIASAAHARRLVAIARAEVVNPELVVDLAHRFPIVDVPSAYLVITDDYAWDAATVRPGTAIPGMVAAFRRLADWKRSVGISARVVTISDIVGGRFGEYRRGSRDLQEIIRRFLKDVVPRWGVSWLLLGGDIGVVPVRRVAGGLEGWIALGTADPPPDNTAVWTGAFLKMHVVSPGIWWPGTSTAHRLVNPDSGTLIPYDPTGATGAAGATAPGWYFTTSDSYATRTTMATDFVRVNGPAALANARLQWQYQWNTLPTDLYYASLSSFVLGWLTVPLPLGLSFRLPYVYVPEHDWDALDNGLYGQHNARGDLDGVVPHTDICVGRAPVDSAAQAETFVNKVIAYESFRATDGGAWLDGNWPRRLLLASSDWGGPTMVAQTAAFPPADNQYHHAAGASRSIIRLSAAPPSFDFELVAEISAADRRLLPYRGDAGPAVRGWFYARSATDLRPNVLAIPLPFLNTPLLFPIPGPWIAVFGAAVELAPANYLLGNAGQDGSMSDQEQLREQLRTQIPGWDTVSRLYEDDLDLTPAQAAAAPVQHLTEARLRAALNAAPHIVSLSGHGTSEGCCGGSSWLASNLINGDHTFIVYADSCLTGQIDADDAWSEALLCATRGGAVAYVGNTRFSWIGVGDDFQRAFFNRLRAVREIGLLNDSRTGLLGTTGFDPLAERWAIFALNLLGDPQMRIYKQRQRKLRISVSSVLRRGPSLIHVEEVPVQPPLPHPAPPVEVLVHVRQGDQVFTARTDAQGEAHLDLSALQRGPVQVTLSHDDCVPARHEVQIRGPEWVHGRVIEILHNDGGGTDSLLRLQVDGTERRYTARAATPDHRLILDAAENAFLAQQEIELWVDSIEDGGGVERFRFQAAATATVAGQQAQAKAGAAT